MDTKNCTECRATIERRPEWNDYNWGKKIRCDGCQYRRERELAMKAKQRREYRRWEKRREWEKEQDQ